MKGDGFAGMRNNGAMRCFAFALLLSLGWTSANSHAQDGPDVDETAVDESAAAPDPVREEARREFVEGTQAAAEGRWADSLSRFQHAYLLSGVPVALFNAAMALRALGRHREARDAFDRLREGHPESDAAAEALPLRNEVAARIALIELVGLEAAAQYNIRLDGQPVQPDIAPTTTLESDPGDRAVVVEREGFENWAWEGRLRDGERLNLTVTMEPLPEEGGGVLRSPAFWIITGLLLAGAGGTLAWYFTKEDDLQPTHDNFLVVP